MFARNCGAPDLLRQTLTLTNPSDLVKKFGGKTVQHIISYNYEKENVKIQSRKRRIQHKLTKCIEFGHTLNTKKFNIHKNETAQTQPWTGGGLRLC